MSTPRFTWKPTHAVYTFKLLDNGADTGLRVRQDVDLLWHIYPSGGNFTGDEHATKRAAQREAEDIILDNEDPAVNDSQLAEW